MENNDNKDTFNTRIQMLNKDVEEYGEKVNECYVELKQEGKKIQGELNRVSKLGRDYYRDVIKTILSLLKLFIPIFIASLAITKDIEGVNIFILKVAFGVAIFFLILVLIYAFQKIRSNITVEFDCIKRAGELLDKQVKNKISSILEERDKLHSELNQLKNN